MNKKLIGAVFICCGIMFLSFITLKVFSGNEHTIISPIPAQHGIKVIYVTPQK